MVEFYIERNERNDKLATDPKRNLGDAGIDVYFPKESVEFTNKILEISKRCVGWDFIKKGIIIEPMGDVLIPTMLYSKMPSNVALKVMNKSGVATKMKLTKVAELIDSSYQGMIAIHLFNLSKENVELKYDERFVQLVPILIDNDPISVSDCENLDDFYKDIDSVRGAGGFGHSGLK